MTLPAPTPAPARGSRRLIVAAALAAFAAGLCIFSALGSPDAGVSILTVIDRLLIAGAAPAAYILAGIGLGRLFRPLFNNANDPLALQTAVGLATLLWLSHLLGWLGLFAGAAGPTIAIAPIALGAILALDQLFRRLKGRGIEINLSPLTPLTGIGLSLLLVAACNLPGALWSSEFGGYDVLEYHLELPQEWLAAGRIEPLTHNVYSFLPSYLESAYTHLGALTFAPRPDASGAPWGLVAGEGYRLISCQLLHTAFAILAAWLAARLVQQLVRAPSHPTSDIRHPTSLAPPLAFALVLLTPWTIVTGSMAYNEMAMLALFAGALIAASDNTLPNVRRSLLTGLLIGAASSVKPTALLFCGVPAALFLLFNPKSKTKNPKSFLALTLPGAAAGLLILAPWLIRNYAAAHNPVFPFAASLFGAAHWTAEQASAYAAAHHFQGGWLERLKLLILPDPRPTQPNVSAHRGLMHPQFGVLFPLTLVAALACVMRPIPKRQLEGAKQRAAAVESGGFGAVEDHKAWDRESSAFMLSFEIALRSVVLIAALVIQLILWLTTTHIQSRFLMPLIVPAAALIAMTAHRLLPTRNPQSALRNLILALLPLTQLAYATWIFGHEHNGLPNAMLIGGPALRNGQFVRELPEAQQREWVERSPELFINLVLPPQATVYLLGDATPLYLARHVLYNTTYDTWPVRGDPNSWSRRLHDLHVDFVLVNLGEIGRLGRSGWLPPDITLDKLKDWLEHDTQLVHAWDADGVYLVHPIEPTR